MDTAAFIISILSALTAIAAAVWAKQSADAAKRSAAAEERGADAAESTLAIEEKRAEAEGRAREEAQAPRIDAGEHFGTMWTLAQNRTKLVGFIDNLGPGVALLERVELGVHREPAETVLDLGRVAVRVQEPEQIAVQWPLADRVNDPLDLVVTYAAGNGSVYRAAVHFTLRRNGPDENGQPMWRSAERRVERL